MAGHSPSGLRKDTTPSEPAHNPSIKTFLMASAPETLEAQLVLLTAQNERLTAQDERLIAQDERLLHKMSASLRKMSASLHKMSGSVERYSSSTGRISNSWLLSDQQGWQHRETPTPTLRLLPTSHGITPSCRWAVMRKRPSRIESLVFDDTFWLLQALGDMMLDRFWSMPISQQR